MNILILIILVDFYFYMDVGFLQKMDLLAECLRDCDRALQISTSYAKVIGDGIYLMNSLFLYVDSVDLCSKLAVV